MSKRVTESFQIETAIRFTQFKPKGKGERDYRKFQNRNSRKGLCNLTIKSMCERGYWKFQNRNSQKNLPNLTRKVWAKGTTQSFTIETTERGTNFI